MADQELVDLNLTEDMVQEIAALAFSVAQPTAIRFVRRLTRKIYSVKASSRDMLGVPAALYSPAEFDAAADIMQAFADFETTANAASNNGQLGAAWAQYKMDVGLV